MYDYTGCSCSVCHQTFEAGQDIVVCPECGTPYHRTCYEKVGNCIYAEHHSADFEWTPPRTAEKEVICSRCGTSNAPQSSHCKKCGLALNAKEESKVDVNASPRFSYDQLYQNAQKPTFQRGFTRLTLRPDDTIDGVSVADWVDYLGPAATNYLRIFKQMEIMRRKTSVSFSAMFFGPFYFFYRKAWKPAFIFLGIELLLNLPSLMGLLILTESSLASYIDINVLSLLSSAASILGFILMAVRGMFGFYFYKKSAIAQIQRIQAEYPDPEKRRFVLNAQGGVSVLAVLATVFGLILLGGLFSRLLGPNIDAMLALI